MKGSPKTGTTGERKFLVESQHAIDFAEGGMPAILCTPWLVWFLEHAARDAVLPFLDDGESTVGALVEILHLAATPVGRNVICQARVVHVEGTLISFQLEARDEHELIGRGFHKLRVINVSRFAKKVHRKDPDPGTSPPVKPVTEV